MKSKKITIFSLAALATISSPFALAISCSNKNTEVTANISIESQSDLEAKIEANIGDVSKSEFNEISYRLKKEKDNIRKYKNIVKIDEDDYETQLAWENILHILDSNIPEDNFKIIKINNYNYDIYDLYENVSKALPMIKLPKSELDIEVVIEKLKQYFSNEEIENLSLEGLINLLINKRRIIKFALKSLEGQRIINITIIRKIIKARNYFRSNENNVESIKIEESTVTKEEIKRAIKQIIKKLESHKNDKSEIENEENNNVIPPENDQPADDSNKNQDENHESKPMENENNNSEGNTENTDESIPDRKPNPFASELFYKPSNHTRVAHWNIKNYGSDDKKGSSNPKGLKVLNIAKAILATEMDIIGITEVNYNRLDKVKIIVDKLNELSNSEDFAYIGVTNVPGVNENSNQNEDVAIIYKKSIAEPIAFDNNQIGASFTKEISFNKRKYARPPFGAMFRIRGYQKPIITIFAHFDAPGAAKNGEPGISNFEDIRIKKQQGSYEVYETMALPEVFNFFASISKNKEAAIVFGGDTNIKFENHTLFRKLEDNYDLKNYYYDLENSDRYRTSLGKTKKYSEPYDKILFKENKDVNFIDASEKEKIENFKNVPFKLDTVGAFKDKIWDLEESRTVNQEYGNGETSEQKLANTVSDHAPVMIDFKPKN